MQNVRVRFAPSPTGPLHIGGVRTALYNYLFAKQNGGQMILRIEDTDSTRFVPGAEKYIIEALTWLGIKFDEGIDESGAATCRQSERKPIYRKYVDYLLENGRAYIAFDTPQELEAKRNEIKNFQYDARTRLSMRNSLTLGKEETERLIAEGTPYVVRCLIEPDQDITLQDLIRGTVTINSSILDDKVLYKSADNLPTYHLATIVDDHLMGITHVIRGEEWLPSAPLHVLLYNYLGWAETMPQFAHLPLLLKPDGNGKLSKRDGDRLGFPVFPLDWFDPKSGEKSSGYREAGYFPEAVVNFLALLGWHAEGDEEFFSMEQLIERFSLNRVSKSGAKFDYEKGKWFNHQYLMLKDDKTLAEIIKPQIVAKYGVDCPMDKLITAVSYTKNRCTFPSDFWEQIHFFFIAPTEYDEKTRQKRWKESSPQDMRELYAVLEGIDDFSLENTEKVVMQWIADKQYNTGTIMNAFRLCLVGEGKGPHMFEITSLLGKTETLQRLARAIQELTLSTVH
ncbi:MAG: glutamate--tRNA ligase [Paludibacteraceae bacterium]|nr:glutamate--tRNA ligase [Paludibacteraceae bacterium]